MFFSSQSFVGNFVVTLKYELNSLDCSKILKDVFQQMEVLYYEPRVLVILTNLACNYLKELKEILEKINRLTGITRSTFKEENIPLVIQAISSIIFEYYITKSSQLIAENINKRLSPNLFAKQDFKLPPEYDCRIQPNYDVLRFKHTLFPRYI